MATTDESTPPESPNKTFSFFTLFFTSETIEFMISDVDQFLLQPQTLKMKFDKIFSP